MPGHTVAPLEFTGVTVMVAVTDVGPLFTATNEGMIGLATGAEPLAANPIEVLLFVQSYEVAYCPVKFTCSVFCPLQTTWFGTGFSIVTEGVCKTVNCAAWE